MSGARLLKSTPPPDTSIDYSSAIGEFVIGLSPIQGWVPAFVPDPGPPDVLVNVEPVSFAAQPQPRAHTRPPVNRRESVEV